MTSKEKQVLQSLDPDLREKVMAIKAHVNPKIKHAGYEFRAFEGYRSPTRQRQLFREKKSKLKFGKHNYDPSRACDIVCFVNGKPSWDTSLPYWMVGYWAEEFGLRWGGRFGDDESDHYPGKKAHDGMKMGWDPYHVELP